jgi:hypothetical protein
MNPISRAISIVFSSRYFEFKFLGKTNPKNVTKLIKTRTFIKIVRKVRLNMCTARSSFGAGTIKFSLEKVNRGARTADIPTIKE